LVFFGRLHVFLRVAKRHVVVSVWHSPPVGNVLGALNAITHELITNTNDAYITAKSVCALLEKIASYYVGLPVSIFLDNARYIKNVPWSWKKQKALILNYASCQPTRLVSI